MQAYAILEMEYEALGQLIPTAHPERENRMNAMEYVHDVVGENERGALESDKPTPPSNPEMQPIQAVAVQPRYVELLLS